MADSRPSPLSLDQKTLHLLRRLWADWVRPRWRTLAAAVVFMTVVAASTGAYPLLIKHAYDLYEAGDLRVIWLMPIAILAITGIKGGAFYLQTVFMNKVVMRVVASLQKAMFARLLSADLAWLGRHPVGTLVSRFTADTEYIAGALSNSAVALIRDALTILALVGSMIYLDWMLSIIVLLVYPIAAWPIMEVGKRIRRVSTHAQVQIGDMTSLLNESLGGARMVRAYRLEPYEQARADATFDAMYRLRMRAIEHRARLDPTLEVLGGLAVGGVIAFGGYRVTTGAGTVGDFTGFVSALLIAAQPIRSFGTLSAVLQEGLAGAQRVFDLLDERPTVVDRPGAAPLAVSEGEVALDGVEFSYEPDSPALHACDIRVEGGRTVALVGRSGAGKSTVFNLIPRFYDVGAGRVTIDGQDVREVTMDSLRGALALVSQDIVLFNDTVRANIAMGRPGASDAEIRAAAEAAAADGFIERMPDGYDTVVGDRGLKLSGGERQRIALARAILKDAPILLLDEATSALDAESEQAVQQALERLSRGRTTLVIAHRLATVRNADRIYVLEAGRVVEEGTHDELLAAGGQYARLCRLQFREEPAAEDGGGSPRAALEDAG
jgi:subfamily B ATP-binding cassette protein MsbA